MTDPSSSSDVPPEPAPAAEEAPLLPSRLSPFAPPNPSAEHRTAERLQAMTSNQLRLRCERIDKRLFELGHQIGEQALSIPSVRGTGLIDLDRILRKLDRLTEAREEAKLNRELDGKRSWGIDLKWLGETFRAREIRTRRQLLISELGLALAAADQRAIREYAPHVQLLLAQNLESARRIDELFVEMRLADEELERREREGHPEQEPKEIDRLLSQALDQVDDVSSKVGGRLAGFGKKAAKGAVSGGGQAALALAMGAASGAVALGRTALSRKGKGEDDEAPTEDEAPSPPPRLSDAPRSSAGNVDLSEIPAMIRELARLRSEGILDDDEFRSKKRELLDRL